MIFHENRRKFGKMLKNFSPAAVVIGALRNKSAFFLFLCAFKVHIQ